MVNSKKQTENCFPNDEELYCSSEDGIEYGIKEYRIRKLTPKECWRLMAFEDKDFEAAQKAGLSNTQLYKQAGNSIVCDVLYYIYKNLYKAMPYLFENLTVGSFFSGIGAFEKGLDKLFDNVNSVGEYGGATQS